MMSLRFLGGLHPLLYLVVSICLALLAWFLYRRRLRDLGLGASAWWLPGLRAGAILLIALTLAEPTVETRYRQGEPGKIVFLLDASASMRVVDREADANRYERATRLLVDPPSGMLHKLQDEFEMSVQQIDAGQLSHRWETTVERAGDLPTAPRAWQPDKWSNTTQIGDALNRLLSQLDRGGNASDDGNAAVVLFTDGQSNSGQSPLEVAKAFRSAAIPIFTVGLGPLTEPPDLAINAMNVPDRVFRTDTLRGTLDIRDKLPAETAMKVEILHGDETVWSQRLSATESDSRRIDFSLPVDSLFKSQAERSGFEAEYSILPIELRARISSDAPETNESNNLRSAHLAIVSHKTRILLIDGRSRWESRYLRNMFARDAAWTIDAIIAENQSTEALESSPASSSTIPSSATPSSARSPGLPQSREALFRYDLVILGDVPAEFWEPQQLRWMREFVEFGGGGLVIVDGERANLQNAGYRAIQPLFPIKWTDVEVEPSAAIRQLPKRAELTPVGRQIAALKLTSVDETDSNESMSSQLWPALRPLFYVTPVEPLPGSETLIEAKSEVDSFPLCITRRFGAGRVLYMATDETWRWRYKAADKFHSRLWNQLARWVRRTPMSVQGEFVSLDTPDPSYRVGEAIELRCSLRDSQGVPESGKVVSGVIRSDSTILARVPLIEDPSVPGFYSGIYAGQTATLPVGEYQFSVEAVGFSQSALDVAATFWVEEVDSAEHQRIACNEELLRKLSSSTRGEYLHEEDASRIVELLRPISHGRVVQSSMLLWQSYWWFCAALLLLAVEWIVRKRVGLI